MKPTPVVGKPVSELVKIVAVFGIFIGGFSLVTAVSLWSNQAWDLNT